MCFTSRKREHMRECIYLKRIPSPVGQLTIACTEDSVCGLWFDEARFYLYGLPQSVIGMEHPMHSILERWLDAYFAGKNPAIDFPIRIFGSAFQLSVWNELKKIPYGQTVSYGQIARALSERTGRNVSARAVGGAVGRNPLSIVIPCHRVIGADGSLTGFGGGLERKTFLLHLEGIL